MPNHLLFLLKLSEMYFSHEIELKVLLNPKLTGKFSLDPVAAALERSLFKICVLYF